VSENSNSTLKRAFEDADLLISYAANMGLLEDHDVIQRLVSAWQKLSADPSDPDAEVRFWETLSKVATLVRPATAEGLRATQGMFDGLDPGERWRDMFFRSSRLGDRHVGRESLCLPFVRAARTGMLGPMTAAEQRLTRYQEQGFVILRDVLNASEIDALRAALQPYLDLGYQGRNNFEGEYTQRVYSLVGRGAVFERTAEHPAVLELVDALLQPGYLLTASQAICIHPGETPQPVHYDDTFYTLPRPRPAVSVSTIWALDDFTAENGGTEVIPGSHLWDDDRVASTYKSDPDAPIDAGLASQLEPVEMPAGSLIFFAGTLLHRGGANRSSRMRRAFSHQYCEPWARQQENFTLSVPRERARRMSLRLRQLLGYSIHPPFMGQLAGRHPEKALAEDYVNSLIADDEEIPTRR
jgi:ectoine hydroxylase-related dioxygenase (phytanoyl-CoA dioxygenase family)